MSQTPDTVLDSFSLCESVGLFTPGFEGYLIEVHVRPQSGAWGDTCPPPLEFEKKMNFLMCQWFCPPLEKFLRVPMVR